MPTARSDTLVAVLPGSKLMVVGGCTDFNTETDEVEIATLQEQNMLRCFRTVMCTICMHYDFFQSSSLLHSWYKENCAA